LINRFSDSWHDTPRRKNDFDDSDNNFSKSERRPKKYEDSVSNHSSEENKNDFNESDISPTSESKPSNKINADIASAASAGRSTKKLDNFKKIDLGAALNFGKTEGSSHPNQSSSLVDTGLSLENSNKITQSKTNEDLLNEIFNAGSDPIPNNNNSNNNFNINNNIINNNNNLENFADFIQFQSSTNESQSSNDEFANFASAFTAPVQTSQNTLLSDSNSLLMQTTNPFIDNDSPSLDPLQASPFMMTSPVMPTNQFADVMTPTIPFNQPLTVQSSRPTDLFSNNDMKQGNVANNMSINNTWSDLSGNVNISVDNLLGSKYEKQSAPTMNQLAQSVSNLSVAGPGFTQSNNFPLGLSPVSAQRPITQQTPQLQFGYYFI